MAAISGDEAVAGAAAGWVARAERLVKARESLREAEENATKAKEAWEAAEASKIFCICGTCASCVAL